MGPRQSRANSFAPFGLRRRRCAELLPVLPVLLLASTILVPAGDAAFTGQSTNSGNSFAAAISFCPDGDGDGICDANEDANTDVDDNPATNPGPDTDSDTLPNYLDADDDGDGLPTASENADPNGDGDPRDAWDSDRDGQPDYLDGPYGPTGSTVATTQKISDTQGGLTMPLANFDRFGSAAASIGDIDGDGVVDLAVGMPLAADGGSGRGAVGVLRLNIDGTVKAEQRISDTAGGFGGVLDNTDLFGSSLAGVGDIDGDGIGDLAVGAYGDDDGGTNRGAVYVLFLNPDGTVKAEQKISGSIGGFSGVLDDNDEFGKSVAGIGDLDGDGVRDLAVGGTRDDDGGTDRGAAHILFLNADGTVKAEQKISSTAGGFGGALDDGDGFGSSLAPIGDVDGDGIDDLVIGAWFDDDGGAETGAVYVVFLNADGTAKAEQKISQSVGGLAPATLDPGDLFGWAATGVGDLNGDGVPDLVLGTGDDDDGASFQGAIYLLHLNTDGTAASQAKISETVGGLPAVLDSGDKFGSAVTSLGDLDGDGTLGLAVGAFGDADGGSQRGAVYILDLAP